MPAMTVPKNALAFGAGYLLFAAAGVSAPANTVAGSVFTDSWPVGWNLVGVTREGHTLNVEFDSEAVEAAEYIDALLNVITGRTVSVETDLMQVHLTNFQRVFNGGTKNTTGSGATTLTTYTLPTVGAEVRGQLGWESVDNTERWWGTQVFNTGSVAIQRQKGANNASLPVTWNFEPDASAQPIYFASAGVTRA